MKNKIIAHKSPEEFEDEFIEAVLTKAHYLAEELEKYYRGNDDSKEHREFAMYMAENDVLYALNYVIAKIISK